MRIVTCTSTEIKDNDKEINAIHYKFAITNLNKAARLELII